MAKDMNKIVCPDGRARNHYHRADMMFAPAVHWARSRGRTPLRFGYFWVRPDCGDHYFDPDGPGGRTKQCVICGERFQLEPGDMDNQRW